MPKLLVSNLEPERMAEAYPLIRRFARVGPERWESFGRQLAARAAESWLSALGTGACMG